MGLEDLTKLGKFGKATDVGTAFMKTQKGLSMIEAAVSAGKIAEDASSIAKYASEQAAIINKGVLDKLGGFTKQLDKASSNKLITMGSTLTEQVGKYSARLSQNIR